MKQGPVRHVREVKAEPIAHAKNERAVSQIGSQMSNHATDHAGLLPKDKVIEQMHKGRGFQAPHDAGRTIHHGGSQRRS